MTLMPSILESLRPRTQQPQTRLAADLMPERMMDEYYYSPFTPRSDLTGPVGPRGGGGLGFGVAPEMMEQNVIDPTGVDPMEITPELLEYWKLRQMGAL